MTFGTVSTFGDFEGFLEVVSISEDGHIDNVAYVKNVITYSATDVMARSLGGDAQYNPTHIKVGGSITPSPPIPVTRDDTDLSSLTNDDSSTGGDPVNNARENLPITSKSYSAIATAGSDPTIQKSNIVTFTASMDAFPENPNLDGKKFYEAAVITKIGSDEIMFSHQFHDPIEKKPGFRLVYTWSIRFK